MSKRNPQQAQSPATNQTADGIPFVEEDGTSNVIELKPGSKEYSKAMDQAARVAIEALKSAPPAEPKKPEPPPPDTKENEKSRRPKLYRVTETIDIPRGASSYKLRVGKIVDTRGYDIASLKKMGVKLEEVPYDEDEAPRSI